MNDRYLFRGKSLAYGKWVEGCFSEDERDGYKDLIICSISVEIDNRSSDILSHDIYIVDPETIGQCTGLRDKNGKLIFEGDVAKIGMLHGRVEWSNNCLCFCLEDRPFHMFSTDCIIEILGNVYDNPDWHELFVK